MAGTKQSPTTSSFNFLKEGLLLPCQNRRLFAAIFAITVASSSLFLAANELGIHPMALKLSRDIEALNQTYDRSRSTGYADLLRQVQHDGRDFLLASAAYLLSAIAVSSAIHLFAIFAAVATYSGEAHTLGSLHSKAKAQLKGPLLTIAFVYALGFAGFALVLALAALFVFLAARQYYGFLLVESLVLLAAYVLYVYFSFVCSLGMVVAVAEPGCHGAGAVRRAWQLVKGRQGRAVLFIAITGVLVAVFSPFYWLPKIWAHGKMMSGALLLGFLYSFQTAAVELFHVCALTVFYFESKGTDQAPETEYVKVSVQDV